MFYVYVFLSLRQDHKILLLVRSRARNKDRFRKVGLQNFAYRVLFVSLLGFLTCIKQIQHRIANPVFEILSEFLREILSPVARQAATKFLPLRSFLFSELTGSGRIP